MNQLPLTLEPRDYYASSRTATMTEYIAELELIFANGITHGQHSAVWVVVPVKDAPYTSFTHYELRDNGICTRKYNNLTRLLEDVKAIAPISEWSKAT